MVEGEGLIGMSVLTDLGATQLDAFDAAPFGWDDRFPTARRVALDGSSWVEFVPGWLTGGEELFGLLRREAAWEQRERWMINRRVTEPRLTAQYPEVSAAPAALREIAAALARRYGVTYDGLWINQYRDHRDSTSWHADWPSCKRETCVVPVLSLGAPRRFLIRPRAGGASARFTPGSGDLIVMGGRAQQDWLHMVPKQARPAGPRISVNFTSRDQARLDG
ncbi:alpha-ketoglutarate-dependent dioxygenase AlkB [Pseudofrankia inefficax]|uniref:Putative alkylated DNA repair protein n=1 Tax=Pseudofrankia inefficax (strain DSM 45817 / CECT 9037 / DDB 130130 / EuI1c) TaxID=298654 RepID=E3J808_PSEI1|nr:alpha-ketoglutarate-dependent dioxygenase AlkB [Pseudofrankia inefficax]ADP82056.1 putative alkylated DNA repair protein [Pseudofrankia inefficax]